MQSFWLIPVHHPGLSRHHSVMSLFVSPQPKRVNKDLENTQALAYFTNRYSGFALATHGSAMLHARCPANPPTLTETMPTSPPTEGVCLLHFQRNKSYRLDVCEGLLALTL